VSRSLSARQARSTSLRRHDAETAGIDDDGKGLSHLLSGRDTRQAESILETYRSARAGRGEASDIYEILCAAVTDWLFRVPADRLAEAQSARQPVFAYRLDWRSPVGEGVLGACHAIDLPFVFGTHQMARRWVGKGEDVDALAADMGDAWVAFARNGNPSTDALPWPSFETTHRKTLILDRVRRVEEQPREEERRCWDGVIP
jgi:para-nitrobenzyl esterase